MKRKAKTKIQLYVSQKVSELREEHNLTQEEFADKIGCSRSYYATRENLNTGVAFNLETINTIAREFNISPKFFIPDKAF